MKKKVKKFEEFINEAKQKSSYDTKPYKDFKDIKIGDIAKFVRDDELYKVIAKGTIKDWNKLKKYDEDGIMTDEIEEYKDYPEDLKDWKLIVIEDSNKNTLVGTYDPDSILVYLEDNK